MAKSSKRTMENLSNLEFFVGLNGRFKREQEEEVKTESSENSEFYFKKKLRSRTVSGWDIQPGQELLVFKQEKPQAMCMPIE